jgi:hypothetical protein
VPPDSALEVVVHVSTKDPAEAEQDVLVDALVSVCHTETRSELDRDSIQPVADDRYRFVLEPTLDDADRRQLQGCLQDFQLDHFLADVESMHDLGTSEDAPNEASSTP